MYYGHPYWYPVPPYYMYPQVADKRYIYPYEHEGFGRNDHIEEEMERRDHGRRPYVVNIDKMTERNNAYLTTLWTGRRLQVLLMSLKAGEETGFERHAQNEEFIKIKEGRGYIQIGDSKHRLDVQQHVRKGDAIMIPAGKWHNLTNIGREPLKVYAIYAPPEHPYGTVQQTKKGSMNKPHDPPHHHHHHREGEGVIE